MITSVAVTSGLCASVSSMFDSSSRSLSIATSEIMVKVLPNPIGSAMIPPKKFNGSSF